MTRLAAPLRQVRDQFQIGRAELGALGLGAFAPRRFDPHLVAASLAINLFGLVLPIAILQVYDRIVPNRSFDTLGWLLGGLSLTILADLALRIARGYLSALDGARLGGGASIAAFERLLYAPLALTQADPPARHLQRVRAVQGLGDFFGGRARHLAIDLPFIPVFIAMTALIGGPLALITLAIVAIFAGLTAHLGRRLRAGIARCERQDAKVQDFLSDVLTGVCAVKGMAMEPQLLRRFERLQKDAARHTLETIELAALSQAGVLALGNLSMVAMVATGGILAALGEASIGVISACALLSGRTIQPVLSAVTLWNDVQRTRLGLQDAKAVFDLPKPHILPDAAPCLACPVSFDGVETMLGSGATFHLSALRIGAGQIAAFTGADDAGRSLPLALLAGLSAPLAGEIRVDGETVADFRARHPGALVLVDHRAQFFRGTLLENLTLFGRGPNGEEARRASALIGLDRDIHRLPLGFETRLGEGIAETLPAGLLKRLAIARAIALSPAVLLLDEPQAFLDPLADQALLRGLGALRGQTTLIIATSRPSYAALADQSFLCAEGAVRALPPVPMTQPSDQLRGSA